MNAALVQQAEDHPFPEGRGNDGNPDVDVLVGHLDGDPAVLGKALLGDVQLGHDLEARNDGRLVPLGRAQPVVEDSVDPVPDLQFLLEGLDVDVARPFLHRLEEDEVDQPDHRGFIAHVQEVLGLFQFMKNPVAALRVQALDHLLRGIGALLVEAVDRPEDLPFAAQDHPDVAAAQDQAQVVQRFMMERIHGGRGQNSTLHLDRDNPVLLGENDGHPGNQGGVQTPGFQVVPVRNPEFGAQGGEKLLLGHPAFLDHQGGKGFAVLLRPEFFHRPGLHSLFFLNDFGNDLVQHDFKYSSEL